jgi:hypothetical protein
VRASRAAVALEHPLRPLEDLLVHDGGVLALVNLVLVSDLAEVEAVGQHLEEAVLAPRLAAHLAALLRDPSLGGPAALVQIRCRGDKRLAVEVQLEDIPHAGGLFLVDQQPPAPHVNVVTKQRHASGPFPLAPRGRDLVARAFGDHLALELGERQQHVEH